ncbi:MAG TPA: AAA family ATPase, partial [Acidimicrobiales bacterium]|nr:AAA family ATPase [Acidimicrobiales bacterium]
MARGPDGPFVGRADLLEELTAIAVAAAGGSGSIVLLTGEAGIGKTSVARAVARRVRDDLAVSWGTCTVDGSAPPFWPWRDLVAESSPALVDADRAIGADRYEALSDLRERLVLRARRTPLLHVIEDLQWADVASVLLLVQLGATIVDVPLLVIATLRTGETLSRPLEDALEEVRRAARVRPLPPLGDDDLAALVRDAGIDPDDELLALVRKRTGGNPLFVGELLRAVQSAVSAEGRAAALARDVPDRVSELVAHRVARLPAAVAELLVTAAVVGAEGDVHLLAAARGTSAESVLDLLEQARAAHLLDAAPPGRWQFRHQLIRDAVYDGVSGPERARHHVSVLEALEADRATPPQLVAHHALAAQPLFDADRAVALAARAGETAFAQHAYE